MKACVLLSLVLLAAASPLVRAAPAAGKPATRPNILFVLADDQRWDTLSCSGTFPIKTPNVDSLAAGGVRFPNAFVTTAICAASRATILTGLYERTHRYTFGTNPIPAAQARVAYPRVLRDAGYRTGHVGKWGVAVEAPAGPKALFDTYEPTNRTPYMKKLPDGTERHLTDIEADHAVKFIEAAKPGEPWCLQVSFNAPHAEDNDPKQYIWSHASDGLYDDVTFPVPATMADAFFRKQPEFLKVSESRKRFNWRFDEPKKYQDMVRGYFRMIADVDRAVGRIREAVAKAGAAADTVIVYTGDNGYFLGDRGFADKWYIYEQSIRVPLIVYDPRAEKSRRGVTSDATALNVDLPATFIDLAGAAVPKTYQGHSLKPLLTSAEAPKDWRTDFFYEHLMDANGPGSTHPGTLIPKSEGVRDGRFTYVRWFEQKPLVEELYDHQADFDCTKNLIADPAFAATAETLRKRTDALRDQYGGPYKSNAAQKKAAKAAASTKPGVKPAPAGEE